LIVTDSVFSGKVGPFSLPDTVSYKNLSNIGKKPEMDTYNPLPTSNEDIYLDTDDEEFLFDALCSATVTHKTETAESDFSPLITNLNRLTSLEGARSSMSRVNNLALNSSSEGSCTSPYKFGKSSSTSISSCSSSSSSSAELHPPNLDLPFPLISPPVTKSTTRTGKTKARRPPNSTTKSATKEKLDKKELKKLKNRQAAERSYLRKKAHVAAMEIENVELRSELKSKSAELAVANDTILKLREELTKRGVTEGTMLSVNRDTILPTTLKQLNKPSFKPKVGEKVHSMDAYGFGGGAGGGFGVSDSDSKGELRNKKRRLAEGSGLVNDKTRPPVSGTSILVLGSVALSCCLCLVDDSSPQASRRRLTSVSEVGGWSSSALHFVVQLSHQYGDYMSTILTVITVMILLASVVTVVIERIREKRRTNMPKQCTSYLVQWKHL